MFALHACATTAPRQSPATPDTITKSEIVGANAGNAYELISRLRPNWLKRTAPGSISGGLRSQAVPVYLDGARFGDMISLRSLAVGSIESVQWLDAARAAIVLPGMTAEPIAGAIVIKTR